MASSHYEIKKEEGEKSFIPSLKSSKITKLLWLVEKQLATLQDNNKQLHSNISFFEVKAMLIRLQLLLETNIKPVNGIEIDPSALYLMEESLFHFLQSLHHLDANPKQIIFHLNTFNYLSNHFPTKGQRIDSTLMKYVKTYESNHFTESHAKKISSPAHPIRFGIHFYSLLKKMINEINHSEMSAHEKVIAIEWLKKIKHHRGKKIKVYNDQVSDFSRFLSEYKKILNSNTIDKINNIFLEHCPMPLLSHFESSLSLTHQSNEIKSEINKKLFKIHQQKKHLLKMEIEEYQDRIDVQTKSIEGIDKKIKNIEKEIEGIEKQYGSLESITHSEDNNKKALAEIKLLKLKDQELLLKINRLKSEISEITSKQDTSLLTKVKIILKGEKSDYAKPQALMTEVKVLEKERKAILKSQERLNNEINKKNKKSDYPQEIGSQLQELDTKLTSLSKEKESIYHLQQHLLANQKELRDKEFKIPEITLTENNPSEISRAIIDSTEIESIVCKLPSQMGNIFEAQMILSKMFEQFSQIKGSVSKSLTSEMAELEKFVYSFVEDKMDDKEVDKFYIHLAYCYSMILSHSTAKQFELLQKFDHQLWHLLDKENLSNKYGSLYLLHHARIYNDSHHIRKALAFSNAALKISEDLLPNFDIHRPKSDKELNKDHLVKSVLADTQKEIKPSAKNPSKILTLFSLKIHDTLFKGKLTKAVKHAMELNEPITPQFRKRSYTEFLSA